MKIFGKIAFGICFIVAAVVFFAPIALGLAFHIGFLALMLCSWYPALMVIQFGGYMHDRF